MAIFKSRESGPEPFAKGEGIDIGARIRAWDTNDHLERLKSGHCKTRNSLYRK